MSFWDAVGREWSNIWRPATEGMYDAAHTVAKVVTGGIVSGRDTAPWNRGPQTVSVPGGSVRPSGVVAQPQPTGILADAIVSGPGKSPGPWKEEYTTTEEADEYWSRREEERKERDIPKPDKDIVQSTPIHDRPFKFNPPLHPMSRPVRVDFGSGWQQGAADQAAVEASMAQYLTDPSDLSARKNIDFFKNARLGRIVQAENAIGSGMQGDYRYGFRFMYNPEKMTTAVAANNQVMIDTGSDIGMALSMASNRGSFQTHAFNLILNRIADLEYGASQSYEPYVGIGEEDIQGVQKYGTMWDLEYLYRVANGVLPLEDMGESGNMGILQANPAFLIIGPGIKHYGFISKVGYTHLRFTQNMIPTLTQVNIEFGRILYVNPEDAEEWHLQLGYFAGEYDDQFSDSSSSSSSGGGVGGTGGGDAASGGAVDSSKTSDPSGTNGQVTKTCAHMWDEVMRNWGDVIANSHCWRANGYGSPTHPGGHACDFGTGTGNSPATGDLKTKFDQIALWLIDNAEALNICYIIWYKRIWNINRRSEGWRAYSGANGNANNDHTNHIHVTVSTDPRC